MTRGTYFLCHYTVRVHCYYYYNNILLRNTIYNKLLQYDQKRKQILSIGTPAAI